jgi:hypothetical protein
MSGTHAPSFNIEAVKAVTSFLTTIQVQGGARANRIADYPVVAVDEHETVRSVSERINASGSEHTLIGVYFPGKKADAIIPQARNIQILYCSLAQKPDVEKPGIDLFNNIDQNSEIGLFCQYVAQQGDKPVAIPMSLTPDMSTARMPMATLVNI